VTYHDSDTEAFVMDALGNRTGDQILRADGTVNFTVDSLTNRYASVGGNSLTHDDAGNLTTDRQGYVYFYDYENRVVEIEDSSSNDVAEYAYDALGRRIRMIDKAAEPDIATLYYYNPDWQVLAEYDGSNNLQRYYIYGNYIDEPLIMNDGTDDYYYGHDHLYSTAVLIEDGGGVVERYEYDAYGTTLIMDASYNPRTMTLYGNPYGFTGRHLDIFDNGNQELNHLRHRETDPYMGRFLQQDPRGINPAGWAVNTFAVRDQYRIALNLYEYIRSSPDGATDPYGLYEFSPSPPPVIKAFCDALKNLPYLRCGAIGLEKGWCNQMAYDCGIFCHTDPSVGDTADCMQKCKDEHTACRLRSIRGRCKFEYEISG
jgi:RHS repeat-associated protein